MEEIKGGGRCCVFVKREVGLSGGMQPRVNSTEHSLIYTHTKTHPIELYW